MLRGPFKGERAVEDEAPEHRRASRWLRILGNEQAERAETNERTEAPARELAGDRVAVPSRDYACLWLWDVNSRD